MRVCGATGGDEARDVYGNGESCRRLVLAYPLTSIRDGKSFLNGEKRYIFDSKKRHVLQISTSSSPVGMSAVLRGPGATANDFFASAGA